MSLHFELINPENWRIFSALKVKKEKEKWVAPNIAILARAFAYRDYNSVVCAICELSKNLISPRCSL